MRRKYLWVLSAMSLATSAVAVGQAVKEPLKKDAVKEEKKEQRTDFIRVDEDKKESRLQTSVTRYVKDGVSVDLIGAVHIADKQYFLDLNNLFTQSEVLLFEMVGGDKMKEGKNLNDAKKKDAQFSFLETMYNTMQDKLDLAGQKDHVDYSKENFVHADLSMEDFQKLQKPECRSRRLWWSLL